MKRTLGLRVAGAILVTFAAITVVFCVVGAPLESRWARDRERMVLTVLESLVAQEGNSLASDLFEHRVTAAQLRVQRLLDVQGVQGVALFDRAGNVVTRVFKGSGPGEAMPVTLKPAVNTPQLRDERERGVLRYEQVLLVVGEPVGSLQLAYDASWLHQQGRMFYILCGGLLLATLVGMLTVLRWLLHRQVVLRWWSCAMRCARCTPVSQCFLQRPPPWGAKWQNLRKVFRIWRSGWLLPTANCMTAVCG